MYIYISIITVFILYYFYKIGKQAKLEENFEVYEQQPFNYLKTGSTPLGFYKKQVCRKPYRYPYTFHQSYPLPHMTYYENL
jgi:hypothetical protein